MKIMQLGIRSHKIAPHASSTDSGGKAISKTRTRDCAQNLIDGRRMKAMLGEHALQYEFSVAILPHESSAAVLHAIYPPALQHPLETLCLPCIGAGRAGARAHAT